MSEAKEQDDKRPSGKGAGPTRSLDNPVVGPGGRIGPFRIERELGRGGAGVVYLAHDTKLDRSVAIKSVPAELADDPAAQSRFLREAKLLASLNHPNIATIYEELEEAERVVYLVLEYVPGETLGERIARGGLRLKEILSIVCEITEAISYAHDKGVIHRDLKPGNIKITPEGKIKVLDLGIAKMIGAPSSAAVTITEPGQVIGTPGYMSPEQARGNPADHRTDIWSFGCILFEMLTGACPFPGRTASEALASILKTDPDWEALPAEAGPDVHEIIHKCLEKDPAQRYQSAAGLCEDLRKSKEALTALPPKPIDLKALLKLLRKTRIAACSVLVFLMLCLAIMWLIHRSAKIRWARDEALPEIEFLIDQDEYFAAFSLALKAEKYIPKDRRDRLWPEMSRKLSIITTPLGADISYKEYSDIDGQWLYLGRSPQENITFPLGVFRWKFHKEGFQTRERVTRVYQRRPDALKVTLQETGTNPGMILIRMPTEQPQTESEFEYLIDKCEVTNEQFKQFVDADGYTEEKYWKHKFIEYGRELSGEDAKERFFDRTNRPGPATWDGGTFPEGEEKYPVGGVSWYEAAAYAEFVGKNLPAINHWRYAADPGKAAVIVPFSNFGEGSAPVGEHKGITFLGLYDMAGNVKEWCWNATDDSGNQRYILGGSWADPDYMFASKDIRSPMNREATNGFRCVQYFRGTQSLGDYLRPTELRSTRDFASVPPISDKEFQDYKSYYVYDRTELKASCMPVDDSSRHWRKKKIEFDAAYGGETVVAYLFLPKGVKSRYHPVVYFPGIGTISQPSSENLRDFGMIDFVTKSGRAVLYPVYKGTYERKHAERPRSAELGSYLNWMTQLSQDLSRSIDYLETRDDMDMEKLTYYGFSWGAMLGPMMLAVEERIRFGVFVCGGFPRGEPKPAFDPVTFASHVEAPILMINGEHDAFFPLKTSVEPMHERLGSTDKELKTYDGGHGILELFSAQIKDYVLKWMDEDKHLGSVDFESQEP